MPGSPGGEDSAGCSGVAARRRRRRRMSWAHHPARKSPAPTVRNTPTLLTKNVVRTCTSVCWMGKAPSGDVTLSVSGNVPELARLDGEPHGRAARRKVQDPLVTVREQELVAVEAHAYAQRLAGLVEERDRDLRPSRRST